MTSPLVPSLNPSLASFRGPASSQSYNSNIRAAYNDLVNAYAALQEIQTNTALANEILAGQNTASQAMINGLLAQISSLEASIASLQAFSAGTSSGGVVISSSLYSTQPQWGSFPSYYPLSSPMPANIRADYSPAYGQLTAAVAGSPVSKSYITDLLTGNTVYPPGILQITGMQVTPSLNPYAIEDSPLQNAVDGNATTFYRRNVYFSLNQYIQEIDLTVTLAVPVGYVSNLLCNYLVINPYPEFGVNISSILLHGPPGSPSLQLLPTDVYGNITPITSASRQRLFFPQQQVLSVDITFSQNNANTQLAPGLQVFSLGASVIDLGYVNFYPGVSHALVPFSLNNNYFSTVTSVGPNLPGIAYNLYYLNTQNDLVSFSYGQSLPAFVTEIFVEVLISAGALTVPVLSDLQLTFVPTYING